MLVPTGAPARTRFASLAVGIAFVALMVSLAACGDEEAPNTVAPSGFVVVRDASAGFAIAVPADWQQVSLKGNLDRFDREAFELTGRNPNLGPAIVQARQLLQFGGKLMAVSQDGRSLVNLTVDKADEDTLDEVAQVTSAKLTEAGATNMAQERTTTGAGPALKLTFRLRIEAPGGTEMDAEETQFVVLRDGKSYVITVQNGTPDITSAVASSFRLR
jgi:hypothetical protein